MNGTRISRIGVASFFTASLLILTSSGCGVRDDGSTESDSDRGDAVAQATIDMVDYVIPDCAAAGAATQIGSEQFRTVPMGIHGGLGRLAIVKSASGEGFEEWSVDAQYLRIRSDTTWAFEASPGLWCDVKCGDNSAGGCQQRWNTDKSSPYNGLSPSAPWAYTVYHAPGKPELAAPWIPRQLTLPIGGEATYSTQMEIKAANRGSCGECWVNFTTAPGASVSRTVLARRHASWHGYEDVVHLAVQSGPGAGEDYFYARNRGWIGFNDQVASGQVASDAFPQSGCAAFSAGSICSVTGGGGAPADSDVPEVPEQPGGAGDPNPPDDTEAPAGCACRPDVDNYCLYPKSEPGCDMLKPGGYCDPDGNGDFSDADWVHGYYEYHEQCK